MTAPLTFGFFFNVVTVAGRDDAEAYEAILEQFDLSERLGFYDAWVAEHHFMPSFINSDALAAAAFLLGRSRRMRVGTAVMLAPLHHPVQVAERAAILDQLSGGRLDLGFGRASSIPDFKVFGAEPDAFRDEPVRTIEAVRRALTERTVAGVPLNPQPRSTPHPPLFIGSTSEAALRYGAEHGIPSMFYWSMSTEARIRHVEQIRLASGEGNQVTPDKHVHAVTCFVADDPERAREAIVGELLSDLVEEYAQVRGSEETLLRWKHLESLEDPKDFQAWREKSARNGHIGTPDQLVNSLSTMIEATGARRLVLFMHIHPDRRLTLESMQRFATEVAPRLQERFSGEPAPSERVSSKR
jgi:alkanesulfonate monooxygenase SsuD/methylene tetrahydromethanopterin reductase-like flavin-dependent oxidoreductase (luciferase family)